MLFVSRSKTTSEKEAWQNCVEALAGLPADARENAFWEEDAFLARLHQSKDACHRVFDLSRYGGIQLNDEKDAAWVRRRLSDPSEPLERREMMLWTEMLLLNRDATDHRATARKSQTLRLRCAEPYDDHRQSLEAAGRQRRIAPD